MSQVMGIFVKFTNSVLNFKKVLKKVTKFGGNWLKNKKVTDKKQLGVENTPPPPPCL